jgi:hypothetical protein
MASNETGKANSYVKQSKASKEQEASKDWLFAWLAALWLVAARKCQHQKSQFINRAS